MARRRNYWERTTKKNTKPGKRVPMLNLRMENVFRFDLNEILRNSNTDERYINSFIATLVTKASRNSIKDARNYVREKCEDGTVDKGVKGEILRLLNRYTKFR